jgi:tetratricopeptide (TPR) repeat protein
MHVREPTGDSHALIRPSTREPNATGCAHGLAIAYAVTAAIWATSFPALAYTQADATGCKGAPSITPDQQVIDCTAVINSGSGTAIVLAYDSRGSAFIQEGKLDRAIRDFDESIRLQPNNAVTYLARGYAYGAKGEYDAAFADFNAAIRLKVDFAEAIADDTASLAKKRNAADALYIRGLAKIAKSDHAGGSADVASAKVISPGIRDKYIQYGVKPEG